MIAFGLIASDTEAHRRYSGPSVRRAADEDSEIYVFAPTGGVARSNNLLLDTAASRDDLEALVIVHPFTEIVDPAFTHKVRAAFADPDVAIVGAVGASRPPSLAWWDGRVRNPRVVCRYHEHGGGELPAYSWRDPDPEPGEVDVVDGFLLALSPWAVRNLRFDEGLILGIGYDVDVCLQAREAGRKVVAADLAAVFHRSLELTDDWNIWVEAHIQLSEKWEGRMLPVPEGESWKDRARRGEAEREAFRAFAHANLLGSDARVAALERDMERICSTVSWRVTEPLRRANVYRGAIERRIRERRSPPARR